MRLHLFWALCAAIFLAALPYSSASAQASRTWVAGTGDDGGPCSITAPCKTFARAISVVATGGEVNCLTSGAYGGLTITKSISIICSQSGLAGVLVGGSDAIDVNVSATSRVILDGLDIEGVQSGINGVSMIGTGLLIIRNCSIRDFTNYGVNVAAPSTTSTPRVVIQNSLITGNLGGINAQGASGATNEVLVFNSLIDSNTSFGLQISASTALVLSASTVTGSTPGIVVASGATFISYGNNVIRNGGTPTTTSPLQ